MVKIICVKKWTETEDMRFITLIKLNTPIIKISQYFPECSWRQIEWRMGTLCAQHGLTRPSPLRKRRTPKQIAIDAVKACPRMDFSQDNLEVGRM